MANVFIIKKNNNTYYVATDVYEYDVNKAHGKPEKEAGVLKVKEKFDNARPQANYDAIEVESSFFSPMQTND